MKNGVATEWRFKLNFKLKRKRSENGGRRQHKAQKESKEDQE